MECHMKKIIGIIMSVFLVVAVSITIYMVTEKANIQEGKTRRINCKIYEVYRKERI